MNKQTRIVTIAAIAVLIAAMAFFPKIKALFNKDDKAATPQTQVSVSPAARSGQALSVNAKVLKYETMIDNIRTKGRLLPDEEVDLSFETSGKITQISFQEGSFVRKGQLLAKVNDNPLQAELKKLEAQLPLAQDRVFRQRTLLEKDAVSQEAFETVNTDLEKLHADIELVKARIAQTELRAPFDGIIGLRQVSEGAYASPSQVVSKLTKISPLKVEFSFNERYVNDIKSGTKIVFGVENDLNSYEATVYAVESKLDENTLSMRARALYPNPNGHLKPGQSASIDIILQEITNAITIPSMASLAEIGRDIAYVYRNGQAHQVSLTKGPLRTASSVQIVEGLNVGDTLITTGIMQLREGAKVVINFIE